VDVDSKFSEVSDSKIYTEFTARIYEYLLAAHYYHETWKAFRKSEKERQISLSRSGGERKEKSSSLEKKSQPQSSPSIFSKQPVILTQAKSPNRSGTKPQAIKLTPTKLTSPNKGTSVIQKSVPVVGKSPSGGNKTSVVKQNSVKKDQSPLKDEDEDDINIIKEMIKRSQALLGSSETRTEGSKENIYTDTPRKREIDSKGSVNDRKPFSPSKETPRKDIPKSATSNSSKKNEEEKLTTPSKIRNYIEGSAGDRRDYINKHVPQQDTEDLFVEEEEAKAWREMMNFKREISRLLWEDERRVFQKLKLFKIMKTCQLGCLIFSNDFLSKLTPS
jgi:hypothetical protein